MNHSLHASTEAPQLTLVANQEHYRTRHFSPDIFAVELSDMRAASGKVILDMAPQDGQPDDILSVSFEAACPPGTRIATQAVRLSTGDEPDEPVISIFKVADRLLIELAPGHRVETDVLPNGKPAMAVSAGQERSEVMHRATVEGFDEDFMFAAPANASQVVVQGCLIDAMAQRMQITIRSMDAAC